MMLKAFFTVVYFIIFGYIIDFVFGHFSCSVMTALLVLWCWAIALIISVGLAEYTVKKIKE